MGYTSPVLDLYKDDPGEGGYGRPTNELGIWLGVSYIHSADVVSRFLAKHDMDCIIRSNRLVPNGYEFFAGRKLVTLGSAAGYRNEVDKRTCHHERG